MTNETSVNKTSSEKKSTSSQTDIQDFLKQNLELSQKIEKQNKKIIRMFHLVMIGAAVKVLLILIPVILALIYLPPILRQVIDQYNTVLSQTQGLPTNLDLKNLDVNELLKYLGR